MDGRPRVVITPRSVMLLYVSLMINIVNKGLSHLMFVPTSLLLVGLFIQCIVLTFSFI